MTSHLPTRDAALARLTDFLGKAGAAYARDRNMDIPGHPHVSGLSPYLRHRIITEAEVLRAVQNAHGATRAAKFIDEVYWRTYWKGWLELRPGVWQAYRAGLSRALDDVQTQGGLRAGWEQACAGQTGIDAFDHWARELVQTGYLHNHARMWFASIWIFTLRLPWELGADFFLRHLLDGDPASNTLSWRWVGGLQTPGKTYLARADNIAANTGGRFRPEGLAPLAPALQGPAHPRPGALPRSGAIMRGVSTGLLLTEEDMSPGWMLPDIGPVASVAVMQTTMLRSPLAVSEAVGDWVKAGLQDAAARLDARPVWLQADDMAGWAQQHGLTQIVTSYAPVGPTRDALRGIDPALRDAGVTLTELVRPEDTDAWPHATHGFFRFRDAIPRLLAAL